MKRNNLTPFTKITLGYIILFVMGIIYYQYQFNAVFNLTLPNPKAYVKQYESSSANMFVMGYGASIICWLWVNYVVYKTKHFYWLLLPLAFATVVTYFQIMQSETITTYTKKFIKNDGSFSVGFIFGILFILFLCFTTLINYAVLRAIINRRK